MSSREKAPVRHKRSAQPPFHLFKNPNEESFESGLAGVTQLLEGRKNIVVITGAGISVSSGIPDFRSKDVGIYETLDMEELGLSCPEDLFDWYFFQEDPRPFYKFARSLYFPNSCDRKRSRARPSDSHKLLALLEQQKRLLRCYTQNIDGLEQQAGVSSKKIVYAHGSLEWATCLRCKRKVERSEIEDDVFEGRVARCRSILANSSPEKVSVPPISRPSRKRSNPDNHDTQKRMHTRGVTRKACACNGVFKPGITFFGETLGENVRRALEMDHDKVDALIVIGTSLSVAPISKVIRYLPPDIPRILINRSIVHPPLTDMLMDDPDDTEQEKDFREGYVFDAYLLGFCDDINRVLARSLFSDEKSDAVECTSPSTEGELLSTVTSRENDTEYDIYSVRDWKNVKIPHNRVFLFPGALAPSIKNGNSDDASVLSYREVAHCDGCSKRIEGTIRKCLSCFDYDLCMDCYPSLSKNHFKGKHVFASEAAAAPFSTTVEVDRANETIVGD